jgi:hypothetical protein
MRENDITQSIAFTGNWNENVSAIFEFAQKMLRAITNNSWQGAGAGMLSAT